MLNPGQVVFWGVSAGPVVGFVAIAGSSFRSDGIRLILASRNLRMAYLWTRISSQWSLLRNQIPSSIIIAHSPVNITLILISDWNRCLKYSKWILHTTDIVIRYKLLRTRLLLWYRTSLFIFWILVVLLVIFLHLLWILLIQLWCVLRTLLLILWFLHVLFLVFRFDFDGVPVHVGWLFLEVEIQCCGVQLILFCAMGLGLESACGWRVVANWWQKFLVGGWYCWIVFQVLLVGCRLLSITRSFSQISHLACDLSFFLQYFRFILLHMFLFHPNFLNIRVFVLLPRLLLAMFFYLYFLILLSFLFSFAISAWGDPGRWNWWLPFRGRNSLLLLTLSLLGVQGFRFRDGRTCIKFGDLPMFGWFCILGSDAFLGSCGSRIWA